MQSILARLLTAAVMLFCAPAMAQTCTGAYPGSCVFQDDGVPKEFPTLGENGGTAGSLKLVGSGTGYVTVAVPTGTITSHILTLPATAGTSGYLLTSAAGSGPLTWTSPTVTVNGISCTLGSTCAISSQWSNGSGGAIYYSGGNVGIGTTGPTVKLDVLTDGAENFVDATSYYTSAAGGGLVVGHARGSAASPTQILFGDALGTLWFGGYQSGGAFVHATAIRSFAEDNFTASTSGANITFETTAVGSAGRTEWMRIAASGNVGIGTTSPTANLDVNGTFKATSTTTTAYAGDATAKIATNAFVQAANLLAMSTVPMAVSAGTYSFATVATVNPTINHVAAGGAITSATVNAGGTGVAVGDLFLASGGNHDAILRVETISGSAAATLSVVYGGTGYTTANGVTTDAGSAIPYTYLLSGALAGDVTIIATSGTYLTASQQWYFANNTTNAHTVTVCVSNGSDACSSGRTAVIPQGSANSRIVGVQTDGKLNVDIASIVNAADLTGIVLPASGGTGIANNAANTITFTGAYPLGLTLSGATSLTLPTSGTLATTTSIASALPSITAAQLYGGTGSAGVAQEFTEGTNTILGNATAATATPTALSIGSCSAQGSAVQWTTNSGFGCETHLADLTGADQTLSGGANLTAYSIGTKSSGTYTVDCGKNPVQFLTNGGAFTLAAPSNDGSCLIQVINNGSSGAITLSGFAASPTGTGDVYATTSTAIFVLNVFRINGTATAIWKQQQ